MRGPAHRLLAFLPPQGALLEGGGRASGSAGSVVDYGGINASGRQCNAGEAPLALLPKARTVDLLFDVADVFTALLDAPPMSEALLRRALPGLIEERLLTDPAECHLVHRIAGVDGNLTRVAVGAIDRATLTEALDAAAQAELRPRRAYSALYSIPAPSGGALSVRASRGRGTVRTAEHSGFAFELGRSMPAALFLVVQQLGIKRIRAYGRDGAKLVPLAAKLRVEVVNPKRDFDAAAIASAVNLLQGRFAPAGQFGIARVAPLARDGQLKPLRVWAALGLAIYVLGLNAYRFKLEAQAHALRAAMQVAFRSAFPSEALVEPIAQAQRHLRDLRARAGQLSADDFSVLNAQLAQLLASAPVGVLAGVEYRNSALTLKFRPGAMGSAAHQGALQARASQQGLDVRFDGNGSAHIEPTSQ
jgi:general secretion pathway protein L